jgi:fructose/tagatose bisphosphate aldolase
MIVTTAQLFKVAYGKFAIGAYNINNAEQAMGLFKGAMAAKAPFIIQLSKGARKYTDKRMLEAIIRTRRRFSPRPSSRCISTTATRKTCYDCIDSGFYSSVMIDASHDPFEENVAITKRVVDRAHAKGLSVEAELGMLGGVEEDIKVDEGNACLTNPEEAVEFVKQDRLRLARGGHRHEPRRLQVQGPAVAPLRGARGDQAEDPRLPHRHARQLQRAEGRSPAHQRGGRHARSRPRAA